MKNYTPKDEKKANVPLRVLVLTTLVALVVVVIVLYRYDLLGGGTPSVETAQKPAPAQEKEKEKAPEAAPQLSAENKKSLENGKKLYEEKTCVLCHGADGKADTAAGKPMNATNLASGQFHNNKDNMEAQKYILHVIENGVPGTGMVSFQVQIPSDQDRKDLAAYVHSLAEKK